jgi:hypothetical protein
MANKRNGTADIRKETFNGKNEGTEETKTPEKKYKEKDKELKKQARREKKNYRTATLVMSEKAARENYLKTQYNIIRSLKRSNYIKKNREVRDKQENILKAAKEILNRWNGWKEFFE